MAIKRGIALGIPIKKLQVAKQQTWDKLVLYVVYVDQGLGAAHSKHWAKSPFSGGDEKVSQNRRSRGIKQNKVLERNFKVHSTLPTPSHTYLILPYNSP